jgi:excisionase family DNA binding protein
MQVLLTLSEAGRILKVSRTKLYLERRAGKLAEVTFGRSVRITETELKRYIHASTGEPAVTREGAA